MIVDVSESGVILLQPGDLRHLHLETSLDAQRTDDGLIACGLGTMLSEDLAALWVSNLRTRALGQYPAPQQISDWEGMLEVAHRRGWASDDGMQVHAHVVHRSTLEVENSSN